MIDSLGGASTRCHPRAVEQKVFAAEEAESDRSSIRRSRGPPSPLPMVRLEAKQSPPMPEDLTADDFREHDLPDRPLKYRPAYRTDVRCFLFICSCLGVLFAVLLLVGMV